MLGIDNAQGVCFSQLVNIARVPDSVAQRMGSRHRSVHQPTGAAGPVLGVLRTTECMFPNL